MERIKRTRNGENEGFMRCWEAGCVVRGDTKHLRQAGEPAAGACGGRVLISVPLPRTAAKGMICGLSTVTQVSLHSDIIIHQLLVERVHKWLGREKPIFCAKWHSAVFCTMQEVSEHLTKSEATGSHLILPSGYIWDLAKPIPLRLLTNSAQTRHTQAAGLHQRVQDWSLTW